MTTRAHGLPDHGRDGVALRNEASRSSLEDEARFFAEAQNDTELGVGNRSGRDPLSVLVVGSGAREHALVWALSRSPSVGTIWAAPGNPGIATLAEIVTLAVSDVEIIADWATAHHIGLVIIGPEAPLALGLADALRARGLAVFGPDRAAAELEWSKAFAKDFMRRHGIPTPAYAVFTDVDAAVSHARDA